MRLTITVHAFHPITGADMDYHPFWVDQTRISAHKDSAKGSSVLAGGRPEWILDQVTMPITPPSRPSFRFRSQHIPLSRFRATRVLSPTNSTIKSTTSGHHAVAVYFSSSYYYSSVPNHHAIWLGNTLFMRENTFNFFTLSLISQRVQWKPMKNNETQWNTMKNNEKQWKKCYSFRR